MSERQWPRPDYADHHGVKREELRTRIYTLTQRVGELKEGLEKARDDLGLVRDIAWALRDRGGMKNLLSIANSGYRDARDTLDVMEGE